MSPSYDINGTVATPNDVQADLFYMADQTYDGKKPYTGINTINGKRPTNFDSVKHTVTIHDITGHEADTHVDVTGFQIVNAPHSFTDFDNEDAIKEIYYPQAEEIYKKQTGASRVFVFDHTLRKLGNDGASPNKRAPVQRAHVDQTPKAAETRVRRHMGDEADELLKKRYQLINLWRPIGHPAYNFPLAVADGRTVTDKELVATTLVYPTTEGETYGLRYSPNIKWYYKKDLTPDQVILLKCFDSNPDVTSVTPHTAFDNGVTDKPGRESIEVRGLLFFD